MDWDIPFGKSRDSYTLIERIFKGYKETLWQTWKRAPPGQRMELNSSMLNFLNIVFAIILCMSLQDYLCSTDDISKNSPDLQDRCHPYTYNTRAPCLHIIILTTQDRSRGESSQGNNIFLHVVCCDLHNVGYLHMYLDKVQIQSSLMQFCFPPYPVSICL